MTDPSSSSRSRLTVLTGPMAGKELVLEETVDNVLIGSDPSCRFHVPGPGVSPIHARLWMDASGVTVYDTNSARGLYVNDDRVSGQAPLRNGDILWLGTPGEDDVVMIQCRLPTRGAATPTPTPIPPPPETRHEDAEETMVLTTSPEMAEAVAEAVAEEQPVEVEAEPATFEAIEAEPSLEPEPDVEPAPVIEEVPSIVEPEPAAVPVLEAVEEAAAAPLHEPPPDEFAIQETQFLDTPFPAPVEEEVPPVPPPVMEEPQAEAALEPEPTEESAFTTPEVPPTLFEDETGHPPVDAEAPTVIMGEPQPVAHEELELPIAPTVRVEQPPPTPRPKPAVPPPAPPPPRPRPTPHARPAHPPVAAHPPARPRPAKPASTIGMWAFLGGAILLLLVAAGLFVTRKHPERVATAPTPAPAVPTTMAFHPPTTTLAPEPPVATPAPVEEAVTIVKTPPPTTLAPAAPSPAAVKSPAPSPSPRAPSPSPKASPSPRVAAAAPTPPPGPSAEALRAQQAATLLGQAEAAAAGHSYDAAAGLFDEVLKLDPQNAKAHAGKAAALALAASMKKTFVAGRTSVQSGKAGKGNMAGFDTEDVNLGKAPEYSGRIEFEVSPRNVKPGDNYTARVFLTNDGKKSFKIGTLNVTTTANGAKSGGPVAATVKEVQPQQRVSLQEVTGVWQDGTTSWSLEVAVVSDHGDTFKNTVAWR